MSNEATKAQLRRFFQQAVEKALNPDGREILRQKREKRKEQVQRRYGL